MSLPEAPPARPPTWVPDVPAEDPGAATGPWTPALAATCASAACLVLLVLGVLAARPDVAVLGAAPLVLAVRALRARPTGAVQARFEAGDDDPGAPSRAGRLHATLVLDGPARWGLVTTTRQGRAGAEVLVRAVGGRRLPVVASTVRTGPQEIAAADVQGVGPDGASVAEPTPAVTRSTVVLPSTTPLLDLPLPQRLRGLTGPHESRRPGEGGGLRDVHPWVPGDRLRRIDWRVTARRSPDLSELYVRREHAQAEAVVVLVVDSRDDLGPDPRTWRGSVAPRPQDATSLDRARQAAASLARAYLERGDRVGLDDLGVRRRPVPPGGGRRQLDRIRHALALTAPEGEPAARLRPPRLPSGALVVVFSTFLDEESAQVAARWRTAGHRVVAVDVLPRVRAAGLYDRERLALRMMTLTREDRMAELVDQDVELVTWRDEPAVALRVLARRAQRRAGAGVPR
ncbi:DUF58 domain-containing protein [Cellulomonas phragmiteti]|uniref:DUF58 domain-containing protein n=1 Tax=Cellulomonas phragmiteti TaxID=478780 RepID=A0ABQ4DQL1_9CELL|nr:DUF58 domain-containing protein [Cellulomonas phragmiteti]GIG41624.1 hypothetical protein Cph01nite_33860 [Cellulomonas phragmiteti]